jgi:hypothetical protein
MTRAQESGENEVTAEAKREAKRTGQNVCAILAAMLAKAKAAGDKAKQKKIERAQKYLGCRNIRKRRKNP